MISAFDNLIWQAVDSISAPSGFNREQWFSLINAVIQKESSYNPNAVSYTGAGLGLMQVNPQIWLNVYNVTRDALFDPWTNISIGSQILRDYINQFGTAGGLGAYFAGPAGRVSNAAKQYAQTVIGIYNRIITKVKELFQPYYKVTSGSWFLPGMPSIPELELGIPEKGDSGMFPGQEILTGIQQTIANTGDVIMWGIFGVAALVIVYEIFDN